MPAVSVIVPVYNVEKYLDKCVHSIVTQTFRDIEIILVDDGSKDKSGRMCDEWSRRDKRVKVIHKENGGIADARNVGLDSSTGEWILFIDSDDWYEKENHIETLLCFAQQSDSDIVCFNYKRFFEKNQSFSEPLCRTDVTNPSLQFMVDNTIFTSSACLKLIKKSILTDNHITFEKGVLSEDIEYNAKFLLTTNRISYCSECFYIYRLRENSITNSISPKHVENLLHIMDKLMAAENRTDEYNSFLAFQYCTLLINCHIAKVDRKTFRRVFSHRELLQYDTGRIVKLVHTVSRFTGIRICSYILYLYFKYIFNKA